MSDQRLPLDGLLVVAVEQAVAAPLCTSRLRDAGARVIKIERPDGDFARGYDSAAHGDSAYFAWINHGKESVVLDFKEPADADLLHRIIRSADVFVQNLAPGALARSGFGSPELRARNSQLITCDISGYGEGDAVSDKKAYDLLVQAESGIIDISGGPNERGRIGVSLCDIGTGVTAHGAVLEALIARSITGEGSGVQVSLFDVAAEWMTVPLLQHELSGAGPTRVGLKHPTIAPYGAFATSDGALTLISIQNEREWARLCIDVLGAPELAADERFDSNPRRVQNREELEGLMGAIIGALTQAEFVERLGRASIAYGRVNTLEDLGEHAALRRREVTTTSGLRAALPAHPVQWSSDSSGATPTVPTIGQHTEAVRHEFSSQTSSADRPVQLTDQG